MSNVEILRHPTEEDWGLAKRAALCTIGKKRVLTMPNDEWKHKILRARHSPIRVLMYAIFIDPLPSWVATHFVRHVHMQPFVQTQRNDRQSNYDRRGARQDEPVMEMLWTDAEELMTVANKRLCGQASEETRAQMRDICEAVIETNPEMGPFLVPFCMEYGCHEFESCSNPRKYLPRNGPHYREGDDVE